MRKLLIVALAVLALLALAAAARAGAGNARLGAAAVLPQAGPPYPVAELFPAEPGIDVERGFAVAADGDWLAMGAPRDDGQAKEAGAVYLFHWSGTTWDPKGELSADPPRPNAQLGFALALRDGVLAAGAPGEGAVYVFARQGDDDGDDDDGDWVQEKRLTGTGHGVRAFGRSLALDAGRLAVGAAGVHGGTEGAVYLYDGESWDLAQVVRPRLRQRGERFGSAVSLAGDVLAVGAPGYDVGSGPAASDAGAVYVFRREPAGWGEEATLFPPESPDSLPRAGQQFGSAVATDGARVFAGAPTADRSGVHSGAVYGFAHGAGGWSRQDPPDVGGLDRGDQLGASLSLSAALLVAGAPAPPPATGTGKVYAFRRADASWSVLPAPTNAEVRDLAGFAAAASGERVVLGGVLGDHGGGAAGAAWSFRCTEDGTCVEEAEAVVRDDLSGKRFGASVALTRDFLAVGAPEIDQTSTGSVYLYRRAGSGWRQEARLTSSYPRDGFGSSVALAGPLLAGSPLEGSLLAVGAPRARFFPVSPLFGYPNGGVDLFVRRGSSWVFEASLAPPPAPAGELAFGTSVAVADRVVAVGAPGDDVPGAVHLFEKEPQGWTEVRVLTDPAEEFESEEFGSAISLHGGLLVIGDPGADDGKGAVYVSVREAGGWTAPQRLEPDVDSELEALAELGASVAAGDGVIAAGAPGFLGLDDGEVPLFGAVFVFEGAGASWTRTSRLSAQVPRRFGSSVALLGERLVAGAPGEGAPQPDDRDRAAVFERQAGGAWEPVADLDAVQPPHGDEFGAAVALSEGFLVVASPGPPRGDRVTVFALPEAPGGFR